MAKGDGPAVSEKGTEEKKQGESSRSEDLECRSQKLGLALMQKEALKRRGYGNQEGEEKTGIARAVKLSSEFLASIIVGVIFGLGFDKIADTLPWGLVFFLFLGFAAGILNILRSVGIVAPSQLGQKGASRQSKGARKRSGK
ncbi:ATP synthase protein I [Bartonella silvatica]|uniref:ATP synthase protein I n=1 Tax=Bartonella silvatica TaxID=357760 RepID=A0ABV2HFK4_9HYPH